MIFTKEKLNTILSNGYNEAVKEENKADFTAFYAFLFKDKDICVSCPHKLKQYWDKLVSEGMQKLEFMKENTPKTDKKVRKNKKSEENNVPFTLRSDILALQMDFGSSETFNNDTITTEIALRYLSINTNRIANFATYPDNWKELVENSQEEAQEEV